MKPREVEGNVVEVHTPKIETAVPQAYTHQGYTYYLGGKSIHVCTQLCTHVYTTVYTRVHYIALGMNAAELSRTFAPRANDKHSRGIDKDSLRHEIPPQEPKGGEYPKRPCVIPEEAGKSGLAISPFLRIFV